MHELGIAQNVVDIVCDYADGRPVQRVRLEVGELSAVAPDAIRFCFELCARGTVVEGAELAIDEIAARGQCTVCSREIRLEGANWVCPCGSNEIRCIAGLELKVKEMEVA